MLTSILKAGEEGYVNTHIIAPPGVFGYGDGPVRKFNPWLVSSYVGRGYAWYIGEGKTVVSMVSIVLDCFEVLIGLTFPVRSILRTSSIFTMSCLMMHSKPGTVRLIPARIHGFISPWRI